MPKRSLAVLVVLVAVGLTHADSRKSNPVTVSPAGAGFTAVFPAKPSDAEKELASAAGNLTVRTHRVEFDKVVYAVTVTEYPDAFADLAAEKILDGVRDGMKGDGELKADKATTVSDAPARELEVMTKKKTGIRGVAVLHKRTLYVVTATGPTDALAKETATEFLKSFAIVK